MIQNELTYTKVGDYQYPNMTVESVSETKLTKYGKMRAEFLKQHRQVSYSLMRTEGTLVRHCFEIQEQAEEMMEQITEKMALAEGISEQLKEQNPIEWAAQMNRISEQAEEQVLQNVVYI